MFDFIISAHTYHFACYQHINTGQLLLFLCKHTIICSLIEVPYCQFRISTKRLNKANYTVSVHVSGITLCTGSTRSHIACFQHRFRNMPRIHQHVTIIIHSNKIELTHFFVKISHRLEFTDNLIHTSCITSDKSRRKFQRKAQHLDSGIILEFTVSVYGICKQQVRTVILPDSAVGIPEKYLLIHIKTIAYLSC